MTARERIAGMRRVNQKMGLADVILTLPHEDHTWFRALAEEARGVRLEKVYQQNDPYLLSLMATKRSPWVPTNDKHRRLANRLTGAERDIVKDLIADFLTIDNWLVANDDADDETWVRKKSQRVILGTQIHAMVMKNEALTPSD